MLWCAARSTSPRPHAATAASERGVDFAANVARDRQLSGERLQAIDVGILQSGALVTRPQGLQFGGALPTDGLP